MKAKKKLDDLIDHAPPGHFPESARDKLPQIKEMLGKFADAMDNIGRYHAATGKYYIDEDDLKKFTKLAEKGSEDALIERLKALPGSIIKKDTRGMTPVDWEVLLDKMAGRNGDEPLPPYASKTEVRAAVKRKFPNIPDNAFDADELYKKLSSQYGELAGKELSPGFDCCVRHLGFWAAVTLVVCIGYAEGLKKKFEGWGIWGDALFWAMWTPICVIAVGMFAIAAVGVIIMCVINPNWLVPSAQPAGVVQH